MVFDGDGECPIYRHKPIPPPVFLVARHQFEVWQEEVGRQCKEAVRIRLEQDLNSRKGCGFIRRAPIEKKAFQHLENQRSRGFANSVDNEPAPRFQIGKVTSYVNQAIVVANQRRMFLRI